MGVMMILAAQLDGLDDVDADATSEGLRVEGDLDAVSDFLEDGWYCVDERGTTPDGAFVGFVVSEAST